MGSGESAARPLLSVVIPVYNEPDEVAAAVATASRAIAASPFRERAEIVVADDGSTADIAGAVASVTSATPARVVRLETNSGRFVARRTGLEAARGDNVLLLDAGIELADDALSFLAATEHPVWNGHVYIEAGDNLFALFWAAATSIAFAEYFKNPNTTDFGPEEFDRFPKGTGCFFAPRQLLLDAFATFDTRYHEARHGNDDATILRWLAARERIGISPGFACTYRPRSTFRSFFRHAIHRGVVFLDGHGRRESAFFPVVIAFYPASVAGFALVAKRPLAGVGLALAASSLAAAAGMRARLPRREILALALLTPVYATAHGIGMWKGAYLALNGRVRSARTDPRASGPSSQP